VKRRWRRCLPRRRWWGRCRGEDGISLVFALALLVLLATAGVALAGFAYTNARVTRDTQEQRKTAYNTDGALDTAINYVRRNPDLGVDPAYQPPGTPACVQEIPGQNGGPAITVSCAAAPTDPNNPSEIPSGKPTDSGTAPPAAVVTLGDRRDNYGQKSFWSLTMQDDHHQPSNVTNCQGEDTTEYGIRARPTVPDFVSFCSTGQGPGNPWNVRGSVGTNSPIRLDVGALNIVNGDDGTPSGGVIVRSKSTADTCGASVVNVGCTTWTYGTADPTLSNGAIPPERKWTSITRDPYYQPRAVGCATCSTDHMPQPFVTDPVSGATGPPAQPADQAYNPNPPVNDPYPSYRFLNWNSKGVPSCGGNNGPSGTVNHPNLTQFFPGVYTDVAALNSLFDTCDGAYWFRPGVYYFNFNGSPASNSCNGGGPVRNEWCIPGGNTSIVGGTPFGWDPSSSATSNLTLRCAGTAATPPGTCVSTGIWAPFWSNPSRASRPVVTTGTTAVDGQYASYTLCVLLCFSSSLTIDQFPTVSPGIYGGPVNVKVWHYETNASAMNTPAIEVGYRGFGGYFGASCGTYTLTKRSTPGGFDQLSADQQAQLGRCLDTGDKLSRVWVRYAVSKPFSSIFSSPATFLDGVEIEIQNIPNQPFFPTRPPNPAKGDPGGNCDPNQPGVQFIFGGESHVTLSSKSTGTGGAPGYASMELCAGPDISTVDPGTGRPTGIETKPQIAVFGVPAAPPLRPFDAVHAPQGSSSGGSASGLANARRIGEPSGQVYATITEGPALGDSVSSVDMRFNGYTPPAGYTIDSVQLVLGYNTSPGNFLLIPVAAPRYNIGPDNASWGNGAGWCRSGELPNGAGSNGPGGIGIYVFDVTSCLTEARLAGNFRVRYEGWCSTCWFGGTDYLDGAEIVFRLRPTSSSAQLLTPAWGCRVLAPNYWNGYGTGWSSIGSPAGAAMTWSTRGSNDCAVIRTSANREGSSNPNVRRGRFSAKGTVYAPSDAVEIGEWDNYYPVFTRGLVARHFRLRNFAYRSGYSGPIAGGPLDKSRAERRVIFTACIKASGSGACDASAGDRILGTAAVIFEKGTHRPQIKGWNVRA
jgi:hypothetical protein